MFVGDVIIKQPALARRLTTRQIIIIKIIFEGFRTANMLQEKKNKMMNNNLFITIIIIIYSGLEIATDTVANATNIFSLATKNSGLVAKVATRF